MIGRVFLGRYEVQRLLGEGGMGRVYLARQVDLGRQVVVKVMHDHIAEDPKFRDRFQRETLLMARFQHANAVTLYDASLNDPAGPCIVMEYVKGVNLEAMLAKSGRMTAPRVDRIIGQLCEVLQAAHDEGIIHRDLKPANLMILDPETPRERVKVMDFGLAKLVAEGAARKVTDTNVDFAVGTPGYIAPEQVRGELMDHRGDLYSVGVMMYELLTGRLPFQGASGMDVLLAHATESPPTFAEIGLDGWVPPAVEELVFDLLAKAPEDRPQSARELAERFAAAVQKAQIGQDALTAGTGGSGYLIPALPSENESDVIPLALSTTAGRQASRTHVALREQSVLQFHMEAWMPEKIAIMKLRGFVHDCGGEVLESVPGMIRVRLTKTRTPTSMSWFGFGKRATGALDIELYLHRADPRQENKLSIHVMFRPSHAPLLGDDGWRDRCGKVFVELRAYLMGNPSA
ncbi:serine/threonine-protein kinase [Fimbriiglobus ruber]|uniref:non-specific serine/threonine protein kinase n=1 Tax=Fimbriiglobus ruber TaxID=1908690 RepID=A0A225DVT8_9BACT|nr:serine/threonine-protein kinase [Fimbriiglobus ruber]OWK40415.1 Serine/threonine-protein kinase PknB [Fimbriiglobus ruber]